MNESSGLGRFEGIRRLEMPYYGLPLPLSDMYKTDAHEQPGDAEQHAHLKQYTTVHIRLYHTETEMYNLYHDKTASIPLVEILQ